MNPILELLARVETDLQDANQQELAAFCFACSKSTYHYVSRRRDFRLASSLLAQCDQMILLLKTVVDCEINDTIRHRLDDCASSFGLNLEDPSFDKLSNEADNDYVACLLYSALAVSSGRPLFASYAAQRLLDSADALDQIELVNKSPNRNVGMPSHLDRVQSFLFLLLTAVRGLNAKVDMDKRISDLIGAQHYV